MIDIEQERVAQNFPVFLPVPAQVGASKFLQRFAGKEGHPGEELIPVAPNVPSDNLPVQRLPFRAEGVGKGGAGDQRVEPAFVGCQSFDFLHALNVHHACIFCQLLLLTLKSTVTQK